MRILLDNNVPVYLSKYFEGNEVSTAYREGWAQLQNGKLLTAAEVAGFDLFVTLDKNLRYQQTMKGRSISVVVLDPQGREQQDLIETCQLLVLRLSQILPGELVVIQRGNGGQYR